MNKVFQKAQKYDNQRYQLSESQEKNQFFNSVGKKIDKMVQSRLVDQDARPIKKEKDLNNVASIVESIMSLAPRFDNQSAVMRPKKDIGTGGIE